MKEHTIWFWIYWGCWLIVSLVMISQDIASGHEPERLFGNIIGVIVLGYVGYRILKWVWDY